MKQSEKDTGKYDQRLMITKETRRTRGPRSDTAGRRNEKRWPWLGGESRRRNSRVRNSSDTIRQRSEEARPFPKTEYAVAASWARRPAQSHLRSSSVSVLGLRPCLSASVFVNSPRRAVLGVLRLRLGCPSRPSDLKKPPAEIWISRRNREEG